MDQRKRKINDGIRVRKISRAKKEKIVRPSIRKSEELRHSHFGGERSQKKFPTYKEIDFSAHQAVSRKKMKRTIHPLVMRYGIWIVTFILALIFFLNTTSKTKITIHPKEELLTIHESLTVKRDSRAEKIHTGLIHVEESESFSFKADSSRVVNGKASGVVTVYNDYSTEAQRLLPHTRFLSTSGKLFRSGDKEIVVPGKKDGKPGQVDVKVYADGEGEGYNIDLTDFTLPGFKEQGLTEKYNGIYAVSKEKFTGGGQRKEALLSEKAKMEVERLIEGKLKEKLMNKLFSQKTDSLDIVEKGVQLTLASKEWRRAGEDQFVLIQRGYVDALVYRKESLMDFLRKVTEKKMKSDTFTIIPPQKHDLVVSYEGGQGRNFSKLTRIPLLVEGKYHIVWNINPDEIISELARKRIDILPQFIENHPHIASFDLTLSPFWKRTIHIEKRKIKVIVEEPYLTRGGEKK